jgi:3'-5' exonuclease
MNALKNINLEDLIFLDIETARLEKELPLDSPMFDSWKYSHGKDPNTTDLDLQASYKNMAALYAEFARIVCITVGRIKGHVLKVTTYDDLDEKTLLSRFNSDLGIVMSSSSKTTLCGHAIKGFDAPFIFKRSLINGIFPHDSIDVSGKKPWEIDMLDTKELWQGSGFKASSLINIAVALGIPSPKSDISGADVGEVYFNEGPTGLLRIVKYCERDVLATANVMRKFKLEPLLELDSTEKVEVEKVPAVVRLANGGPLEKKEIAEIKSVLAIVPDEEKEAAFSVLEAISVKKGTKLTKAFITKLKKEYA